MKGNILPTFQTFSVTERVQVEKLKQWDVKIQQPSNLVANLLGVTEEFIVPDNFESVNRLPLKPPNERYLKPNFAQLNGPSPLSHAHRGVADKSSLSAPRERKKVEKTVPTKPDPHQYFKIENGSSGELDIYVQTPFSVRSSELKPHCVWTRDISGYSSSSTNSNSSSSGKMNGDGGGGGGGTSTTANAAAASSTAATPQDDDYFRIYSVPAKELVVSMTGKQRVQDYTFGPGPIGMQVEIAEVDEHKELCCSNVVEGSQAWQYREELSGAIILAVNGQRVLSLLEFQTAVTVAKDVVGRVIIKALAFNNEAARTALQQKWNLKKNKNIKSLLTGSLGMFGGGGGGGKKSGVEGEAESSSSEEESGSNSDDDDSDNDSKEGGGSDDLNGPPPAAQEEETDSDEEDDILYRRHRRFKEHQKLVERHHEAAVSELTGAGTGGSGVGSGIPAAPDLSDEARGSGPGSPTTTRSSGKIVKRKEPLTNAISSCTPDPHDVYHHQKTTPYFKKPLVDRDADLLFSPELPPLVEFDALRVEAQGEQQAQAQEQAQLPTTDNQRLIPKFSFGDAASASGGSGTGDAEEEEDEDEGGIAAKPKARKNMSFDGRTHFVMQEVTLSLPEAEEEEEQQEAVETVVEAETSTAESSVDPVFLTGTNIVDEFTDLTPFRTLVCPPELFGIRTSTWGVPTRYCQYQNFSAYCKLSIYWVDEEDTLVLRKVLYPFDEPYLDLLGSDQTWVLTMTKLKASRLAELREKLKLPPVSSALTANATGTPGNSGNATMAVGAALIQENEEENEDPTLLGEEEGGGVGPGTIGLNGLPRTKMDGNNSCLAFRPCDAVINNPAKSLSLVWIPEESVTLSQRMRAISTLFKVPQHYSRHNPLHQRRPQRRQFQLQSPTACVDDINRQNPNVTVQVFDPRAMKLDAAAAAVVPNSVQGKRTLAAAAAANTHNRPNSGPGNSSSRPSSQHR